MARIKCKIKFSEKKMKLCGGITWSEMENRLLDGEQCLIDIVFASTSLEIMCCQYFTSTWPQPTSWHKLFTAPCTFILIELSMNIVQIDPHTLENTFLLLVGKIGLNSCSSRSFSLSPLLVAFIWVTFPSRFCILCLLPLRLTGSSLLVTCYTRDLHPERERERFQVQWLW